MSYAYNFFQRPKPQPAKAVDLTDSCLYVCTNKGNVYKRGFFFKVDTPADTNDAFKIVDLQDGVLEVLVLTEEQWFGVKIQWRFEQSFVNPFTDFKHVEVRKQLSPYNDSNILLRNICGYFFIPSDPKKLIKPKFLTAFRRGNGCCNHYVLYTKYGNLSFSPCISKINFRAVRDLNQFTKFASSILESDCGDIYSQSRYSLVVMSCALGCEVDTPMGCFLDRYFEYKYGNSVRVHWRCDDQVNCCIIDIMDWQKFIGRQVMVKLSLTVTRKGILIMRFHFDNMESNQPIAELRLIAMTVVSRLREVLI